MTTILWDWNGTLIDDVDLTVRVNDEVFTRYGYPSASVEGYRRLFRFPVKDYYTAVGVTDADFPAVAKDWFDGYIAAFPGTPLHADVAEAVALAAENGWRQTIISASRQEELSQQVAMYPALAGRFDEVLGLSHHLATSKVDLAKDYMARTGADPAATFFLGDTCHDAEVAEAIGCRCILIAGGHQCDQVIAAAGAPIAASRVEAIRLVERLTQGEGSTVD